MSLIPETSASAAAIDSFRDIDMRRFDVTLISTPTLMSAERAGLRLDQLSRLIVIVPTAQPQQLEIAARQPAHGYIMQDELTSSTLSRAISAAVAGQLVIPDAIAAYLLNRVRDQHAVPAQAHLRPREAQVLELLVAGDSNKEIARKLRISIHGVKRHVSSLLMQFNSPNRVHLVSHILQSGLIPMADMGADRAHRQDDDEGRQHQATLRSLGRTPSSGAFRVYRAQRMAGGDIAT
jgi:DNA-binding NarL/FixJ family response regulator